MKIAGLLALAAFAAACGGDRPPTSPTPPTTMDDGSIPPGTALTIVNGETGAPVAGARVVVAGQDYASDTAGGVSLTARAARGSLVDVLAPAFFDRQTLLRSRADTRLTLWPRRSLTGLDETLTGHLVYTLTTDGAPYAEAPLRRPPFGTRTVTVALSAELAADPEAVGFHERAVGQLTAANGGQVSYVLGPAPPGMPMVDVRFDPADPGCEERVRAFAQNSTRGGEVVSTRIVYCVDDAARSSTVAHELGHAFGLRHSPSSRHVMYGFHHRGGIAEFTDAEVLAMALMLQRRGNNRFPDDDRQSSASGDLVERFVCR